MTEYLPEKVSESVTVGREESTEFEFRPKNPGLIEVTATAPRECMVELFSPTQENVLSADISGRRSKTLALQATATDEDIDEPWRIRITNLELITYEPETVSKSATLNTGDVLEIEFTPKNQGPIKATADAPWDRTFPPDPTKRKMEFLVPGQDTPLATEINIGLTNRSTLATIIEADPREKWILRVTNLEKGDDAQQFSVMVSYPGDIPTAVGDEGSKNVDVAVSYPSDVPLLGAKVDAYRLEQRLNELLETTEVRLTSGSDQSVVRLLHEYGIGDYRFSIPGLEYELPGDSNRESVTVREWINDVSSKNTRATLLNGGTLHITLNFEEHDHEFLGETDLDIHLPYAHIDLQLDVNDGQIECRNATARFDFESYTHDGERRAIDDRFGVGGEPVDTILYEYLRDVRSDVTQGLEAAFSREAVRRRVADVVSSEIKNALPNNAQIYDIAHIEQGSLMLRYFKN